MTDTSEKQIVLVLARSYPNREQEVQLSRLFGPDVTIRTAGDPVNTTADFIRLAEEFNATVVDVSRIRPSAIDSVETLLDWASDNDVTLIRTLGRRQGKAFVHERYTRVVGTEPVWAFEELKVAAPVKA